MSLYNITGKKLDLINESGIKYVKSLQDLTEANLDNLFDLQYLESDFKSDDFIIDTLAIDSNETLVAIIYKKYNKYSLEEIKDKSFKVLENYTGADFNSIKLLFIFQNYTIGDFKLLNISDSNIEFWKVSRFDNNTIFYDKLFHTGGVSVNKLADNDTGDFEYLESDHLHNKPYSIIKFYNDFKQRIQTEFSNVVIVPTKTYIAFRVKNRFYSESNRKNIILVEIQNDLLKIWIGLKKGELKDPKNFTRDVSMVNYHVGSDYELKLRPGDDLNYFMSLFKQSYENQFNFEVLI